ncbi:HET domain-containing protein [Lasiodiplodia theobromae]|uniref:HET domain-containing protein n=1 Tax=Lasiodiplodia theobromae TaxID=45133 RepID=A0A8H7IRF1_9PEZI|nr:HET domain-containing protein [Lasiodiplodia theobromae]
MDHLPYPSLGVPPIVVPYLSGFEYDGEDFATFPERVGFWKAGKLDLGRPYRQLAALAQAWLFFGLIDLFTGQRVDKGVLVRREHIDRADEGVVDTTMLGGILEESLRRPQMPSSRSKALEEIRAQLLEAAWASSTLDQIQGDDFSSSTVFLSIKILIICLSEMFDFANFLHFGSSRPPIHPVNSLRSPILETRRPNGIFPAPARLLIDRMRQSGWCIHQILDIFRAHHYYTVYYYSSIARSESWDEISHEACTEAHCVAYNIKDNSAYKIRHIEECSGCELIGPPEDEVADIVRKGDIPLVKLNSASLENQTQLEVTADTPYSRYTAISHVWIDGRGNPTANTLPKCQLQRLAARLSAISNAQQSWVGRLWKWLRDPPPTSHLLWMDTLCIPPQQDSEDRKSLRKKAIHRMALIYVSAEQVLVLDAELENFTHESSPRELTDALISCARWNARCWTLEEGALARRCLFQFKDVARKPTPYDDSTAQLVMKTWRYPSRAWTVLLPVVINGFQRGPAWYAWPPREISHDFAHDHLRRKLAGAARESAQTDIGHAWRAAERRAPGRDLQAIKFVRTWNDVGRRSTTRPEDIHPIMANLTDFNAAQIMGLKTPVLRTKMITHCIGEFPLDILWTPCARPQGNKDSADRWIPSVPGPEPLVEKVQLRLTSKGLVVDAENFSYPPQTYLVPRGMVNPRFWFYRPRSGHGDLWYVVECVIPEEDALRRSESETACLILSSEIVQTSANAASIMLRGARLLVTKDDPETSESLCLRYDCPVICRSQWHPPDVEQIQDAPIMKVHMVSPSRKLVIESDFDLKDRERFFMRSRDFSYGYIMILVDIFIILVGIALIVTLGVIMAMGWILDYSDFPVASVPPLAIASAALSVGVCYPPIAFIWHWKNARGYNAWKATFEEDWTPRDSFVRRFVKAVRLPRRRKRTDQEEELVNV